ncbi:MAG: DUF4347 domain-containing protein, partial [Gammaproteobacteria bacterium]|nr:DUF4347 domain-containing protein [Gammaproteobacteria bacterium]
MFKQQLKKTDSGRSTFRPLEVLEPRIMMSADPLGLPANELSQDPVKHLSEHPGIAPVNTLQGLLDISPDPSSASSPAVLTSQLPPSLDLDLLPPVEGANSTDAEGTKEIVFIDSRVDDYQLMLDDLMQDSGDGELEVFMLDGDIDGIGQISDFLQQYTDVDAIHVISHGSDQGVQIGDTWLTQDNLSSYSEAIQAWSDSLSIDADLLIYGCNLAASADGVSLIDGLGSLTGADVAASDDLTGHTLLGGDWDLEHRAGDIETDVAFSTELQNAWSGLLAETVHESYETGTDSFELSTSQSWGQTFVDTDGAGTFTVNRISVWMMENNSADKPVTVSLRDDWAGTTIYGSGTIDSDALSDSPVFARYDFDFADVTLDYGTTYYIRIDYDSASGKVFVEGNNTTGTYAGGDLLDNGAAQAGQDMKFRVSEVTGNTPPVLTGDLTAMVDEAGTYTILAADLGYTDPDDGDAGVTFTTSSATNGKIQVGGVDALT